MSTTRSFINILSPWKSVKVLVTQSCPTLWDSMNYSARQLCPWNSPGKNTEVGCHFLHQGVFPIHGLNLSLLHCKETLYHLGQQGSHHIYEKIFFRTLYYTLKCPVIVQKPVSPRNPAENIFQTGFITSSQHTQMLSYIHYLLTIF